MAAPGIMAGASMASGLLGNMKAQGAANKAQGTRDALNRRLIDRFDRMMGIVHSADVHGQFDPNQTIGRMKADANQGRQIEEAQTAAGAEKMGYQPGDTAFSRAMGRVSERFQTGIAQNAEAIRSGKLREELSAYGAPSGQDLAPGINAAEQDQQMALSQMQDPSGMLSSLMPYLQGKQGMFPGYSQGARMGFTAANPKTWSGLGWY